MDQCQMGLGIETQIGTNTSKFIDWAWDADGWIDSNKTLKISTKIMKTEPLWDPWHANLHPKGMMKWYSVLSLLWDNLLLDSVKHEFYTTSLSNFNSK